MARQGTTAPSTGGGNWPQRAQGSPASSRSGGLPPPVHAAPSHRALLLPCSARGSPTPTAPLQAERDSVASAHLQTEAVRGWEGQCLGVSPPSMPSKSLAQLPRAAAPTCSPTPQQPCQGFCQGIHCQALHTPQDSWRAHLERAPPQTGHLTSGSGPGGRGPVQAPSCVCVGGAGGRPKPVVPRPSPAWTPSPLPTAGMPVWTRPETRGPLLHRQARLQLSKQPGRTRAPVSLQPAGPSQARAGGVGVACLSASPLTRE